MSNTYRYYGTVESRGRNYRQLPNPKPKANLGEGRSAKNLEQQLAEQGVNIRLLAAEDAVKNKNFDAFKKFSDEQIRQMYPDDPQLANYLINGKNGTFMRDVKSLNEDAIAYEKKHGKVPDADVDSIIDAAIQKRDKKSLEDMGILTNDAIERWIDRHPNNSGFGKTGNILKSWRDEPAKYVIESEPTNGSNASKPAAEINTNQSAVIPEKQAAQDMVDNSKKMPKEEKSSKSKSIDDVWADVINEEWHKKYDVDWNNPEAVQNAKEDAFRTNDYTSYRYLSDDQIRQLYPDPKEAEALINGKYESAKHKNNPDYDDKYLQYSLMDDVSTYPNYGFPVPVGEIVPPVRAKINKKETVQELPVQEPSREPLKNNVTTWERPPMPSELPKKIKSNNPFLLIDPAEFKKTFGDDSIDLNTPYGWSSYPYVKGRGISYNAAQPLSTAQKIVAGLGLGALSGIYGLGSLMNNSQQTQPPYRMELEPVNEVVAQAELTPEQQSVLQSTSPFDYGKIANLFDLYARYGSPDSPIKIDPVKDKELIDEAMSDFESPQNPPDVGTNINDANLVIPDADEAPEELNDAMLDARSGSFWKASRGTVASRVNAAKNAAQNVFGRTLTRSKAAPKVSNGSASNIQDASNGSIVLNDPNYRKTRDVQNNSVTPEQTAASQMVNQFAGIPVEVIRAKNSGYNQPPLNHATDAIWDRVRKAGLSSPEQAIRSGLFTPDEVRYITENDLWRYR